MNQAPILVQKFGGTSVSTAERRLQAVEHVRRARAEGYRVAVVVSAMGRRGDPYATDTLLDLLRCDGLPVDGRDYDLIFGCGEIVSAVMMAHLLKREGIPAAGLTGGQAGIYTDGNYCEAEIVEMDPARIRHYLDEGAVPVIAGCQGIVPHTGDVTTLGRGGSDTSSVAVGVALGAALVEIYTDVEGVARVDPRTVPQAGFLKTISYERMLDMARYGAGVVHPRAVRTARNGQVPVAVRCTFSMAPGTTIAQVPDEHPLLGLALLGPLRTVVLGRARPEARAREEWERCRLVMTLEDAESGALVAGASPDRVAHLRIAARECGAEDSWPEGEQAWVSLVGSEEALHGQCGRALDLLAGAGVSVLYYELAGGRATFVVSADRAKEAVRSLYQTLIGG